VLKLAILLFLNAFGKLVIGYLKWFIITFTKIFLIKSKREGCLCIIFLFSETAYLRVYSYAKEWWFLTNKIDSCSTFWMLLSIRVRRNKENKHSHELFCNGYPALEILVGCKYHLGEQQIFRICRCNGSQ